MVYNDRELQLYLQEVQWVIEFLSTGNVHLLTRDTPYESGEIVSQLAEAWGSDELVWILI